VPSFHDAGFAIGTGILGLGLAYQLWDYGVKFGHVYILGGLTYFARVFAMLCLVVFGKADLTLSLVVACVLSIAGAYICSLERINFQGIFNFFRMPFRKTS
jgi:drug/metabolite transporter (DMT)-like permease